ncbi:MAG: hypothetical protein ACK4UJ_00810 [Leptonema sp. (in: bacteria)]
MFYFDSFKHLYLTLNQTIVFPSTSLIRFDLQEAYQIYQILLKYFFNFSEEFKIYPKEIFLGQKKYLSFLKIIKEDNHLFSLELRVLISYAGGAKKEEILDNQQQNYSPSFKTNKIYFYLFLYRIHSYKEKDELITGLEPYSIPLIRNYKIPYIDVRIEPWTVNLFDEMDYSDLLDIIESRIPYEWKGKSWRRPFSIERATLAINLVSIGQEEFIKNDFLGFIENIEKETYESEIFKRFYSEWEVEKCFSNSGNLHWKFVKIPFVHI